MKQWIATSFRWLTTDSIKKFFDLKEMIYVTGPTVGFYHEFVPKHFGLTDAMVLASTGAVFIGSFCLNIYKRFAAHERSIAEVLATGYFHNFFERSVSLFRHRLEEGTATTFLFGKGDNARSVTVPPGKISFTVILPESQQRLHESLGLISKNTLKATIDSGMWFDVVVHDDASVTIYDCPRTLTALRKYLVDGGKTFDDRLAAKLYKHFSKKFTALWEREAENIPPEMFLKHASFPEPAR